jgi:serine/threonine-protein kinase HipA
VIIHPDVPTSDGEEVETLAVDHDAELRFSLAGVQLKFSAIRNDRGLTIPVHGRGGDWIVKLPDERYDGVPENEHAMLEFARAAGIDVPQAQLVETSMIAGLPEQIVLPCSRALAIERFDRAKDGDRVHIEDFAQVLDLSPDEKYRATNYDTIARVLAAVCTDEDVDEFLRRLVFMVAIGNSDAHAKNWSLIYPDGRAARLAPAYDLLAVSVYERSDQRLKPQLALGLAGASVASSVTETTFRRLAQRADLDEERTITVVRNQVLAIHGAWSELREGRLVQLGSQLKQTLDDRFAQLPLFE